MISFTLLTDTPARLRNQLIARGIVETYTDRNGQQALRGVRPGVEWVEVPNPIVTTMPVGPRYLLIPTTFRRLASRSSLIQTTRAAAYPTLTMFRP